MKKNFYPCIASGKRLIALFIFSFLLCGITSKAQTFIIFEPSTQPTVGGGFTASQNDANGLGIETGIKIQVTQSGTVSAIRFYRGSAADNQTYTANLWDIAGTPTLVASGTLTISGSPAAGWQEITLSSTYHINANHTYVASVHRPNGNYSVSQNPSPDVFDDDQDLIFDAFRILGFLSSPADPANPGNGVWVYSNTPTYPGNNGNGVNYWVDVVFTTDFTLPVSLSDFRATTANKDVSLTWKTSFENNNRGFEVERSNNGSDWYDIGFVNGAGTTTVDKSYGYTDKNLAPGLYYYRLNQVDFDGRSKTSPVVTANISGKGQVSLFTPNPLSGTGTIRFDLPRAQRVRLSLFDVSGREIKVLADNSRDAGSNIVTLSSAGLGRQLYFVRLRTEDGIVTKPILVE